ncbi:LuxR C-terminal-related transcriptional regulator [Zhongshania sp.]|uniref:LuxR C-terminal-related transcriptional regulator n=1 Tax=Zhongshania sp. TaxID=1971902 RepID=UPI0035634C9F
MTIYVCSKSSTFFKHVDNALSECGVCQLSTMTLLPASEPGDVCIVHLASFSDKEIHTFVRSDFLAPAVVALADDVPSLVNLLTASERGAKAYFNSYMAPQHYVQLIRLLEAGGSWFPPALLREVFALAKAGDAQLRDSAVELEKLTVRERELAEFVAEGRSNKEIALACNISERTVKSHLTSIYEKLDVKDRKGLMALLSYRPASA